MSQLSDVELETVALNSFRCLEIKPHEGHKLIIYADDKNNKSDLARAYVSLANSMGIAPKVLWLDDFSGEGVTDDETIKKLIGEATGFFNPETIHLNNVIEFSRPGRVRNAFIKEWMTKEAKAYSLSMPCHDVGCLYRLLGGENDPNMLYDRANKLADFLKDATNYKIDGHGVSIEMPLDPSVMKWVISVGLIKRVYPTEPMWGNCGGEIFTSLFQQLDPEVLSKVNGTIPVDVVVSTYKVPQGNVIYLPVENGKVLRDRMYTHQGTPVPNDALDILSKHDGPNDLYIGEFPAIGITKGVNPASGEPLEVEKAMDYLHLGIGKPEGERGTGARWDALQHTDVVMKDITFSAMIGGKWIPIISGGKLVELDRLNDYRRE